MLLAFTNNTSSKRQDFLINLMFDLLPMLIDMNLPWVSSQGQEEDVLFY